MLFKLHPFARPPYHLDLQVEFQLCQERGKHILKGQYFLNLDLQHDFNPNSILKLTAPVQSPGLRSDQLWESTCFEFFLAPVKGKHYWEFNLSPDGSWNFYSLKSYRSELREAQEVLTPPVVERKLQAKRGQLQFSLDLTDLIAANPLLLQEFKMACSAVIKWQGEETSYYALQHPQLKPDFHHPEGFVLTFKDNLFHRD